MATEVEQRFINAAEAAIRERLGRRLTRVENQRAGIVLARLLSAFEDEFDVDEIGMAIAHGAAYWRARRERAEA